MEDELTCKCGKNPANEPHRCPFQWDVHNNDDDEYCTCCDECELECIMDI